MSQMFTIHFLFAQKTYPALVAIGERKENIIFCVYIRDKRLHSILPQGKLYIDMIRGVVLPEQLEHASSEALIGCITDALSVPISQEEDTTSISESNHPPKQKT